MSLTIRESYRGKRVFITGHTGFKGSWLTQLLTSLGATVKGYALPPSTDPSHFFLLDLDKTVENTINHICDRSALETSINDFSPDIVFHLAAQPIVQLSCVDPYDTIETNIMGTANILEVHRHLEPGCPLIVITSDKCYKSRDWVWGYREIDELGGNDPYSMTKGCAELLAHSYRWLASKSGYYHIATARAGNVIGGGDWSPNRIIPDIVRAITTDIPLQVRFPEATRPWQHVLDALWGYLLLGEKLMEEKDSSKEYAAAWNFGPPLRQHSSVESIVSLAAQLWPGLRAEYPENLLATRERETRALSLDSSKAYHLLDWSCMWNIEETVARTIQWYKEYYTTGRIRTQEDIDEYLRGRLPYEN